MKLTAVIRGNNRAGEGRTVPDRTKKTDGSLYKFRMFYDGGRRIVEADSTSELAEVLIRGYAEETDEAERHYLRTDFARGVQANTRVGIIASLSAEQWDSLSEEEQAILSVDFDEVVEGTFGKDGQGVWSSDIPLILVDTDYRPYTDIVAPVSIHGDSDFHERKEFSNIFWLYTNNDTSLVRSLNRIGYVILEEF